MTNRAKGIISIIASAFSFAIMAVFLRMCDNHGDAVNTFQKSLVRNAVAFSIALGVFLYQRRLRGNSDDKFGLTPKTTVLLVCRSIAGATGIFANFYAICHAPIAEALALNKTAPFFTVFFTWLVLKEATKLRQFAAILIAFAGVLMVMKPGFAGSDTYALCWALAGGLSAGIAYTFLRILGKYKVNPAFIILFASGFATLASVPFLTDGLTPMTTTQVLLLLAAGAAAAVGQFGITKAYRYAPPRQISVFDYSNIIFAAILGFVFFDQVPDVLSALGFVTIIAAAVFATSGNSPRTR